MKKFKVALIVAGLALTAGLMVLSCGDEKEKPIISEEKVCTINPNVPVPYNLFLMSFNDKLPTGTISSAAKLEEILDQFYRVIYNEAIDDFVRVYFDMFSIGFELGDIARDWDPVAGETCFTILSNSFPACAKIKDCEIEDDSGKAILDFGAGCDFTGEAGIGGVAPDTFGRTTVTISGILEVTGSVERDLITGLPEFAKVSGDATNFSDGLNTFNCGRIGAHVNYDETKISVSEMPVLITVNGVFDGKAIALAIFAPNSLFGPGQFVYYIDGDGNIYTVNINIFGRWVEVTALDADEIPCQIILEWDIGTDWDVTDVDCGTGIVGPITGPEWP